MSNEVTLLAAFGAGVVSFLSPCALLIVPGYLSIITGLDLADLEQGRSDHLWRIARNTAPFVDGFGVVFVAMGVSASAVGRRLFGVTNALDGTTLRAKLPRHRTERGGAPACRGGAECAVGPNRAMDGPLPNETPDRAGR